MIKSFNVLKDKIVHEEIAEHDLSSKFHPAILYRALVGNKQLVMYTLGAEEMMAFGLCDDTEVLSTDTAFDFKMFSFG